MKLRRSFTAAASALLICALLQCGCAKTESSSTSDSGSVSHTTLPKTNSSDIEVYESKLSELQYNAKNPVIFCADKRGGIACMERESNAVRRYSADGELSAELALPEGFSINALACDENKTYVLGQFADKNGVVIGELSDGFTVVCETELPACARSGLVLSEGKLYFSADGAEHSNIEYPGGFYSYDGTVIYCLDPANGNPVPISAENPVCFAANGSGITIYGCDPSGFYFADYNGQLGDKQYSALGVISAFCPIGENVVAFAADGVIKAALTSGGVSSVLTEDKPYGTQPFALSEGSLVYSSANEDGTTVIKRIQPRGHIKNLRPIDIIMSFSNLSVLSSAGYALETLVIPESELSLKLLSGDTDWDAAVIYSRQSAASEIAEQGIFFPLGDIAEEYLAECPEGVREVCTKNGDIWAIPLETNVGTVLYNKEKCAQNGIDLTAMTAEDFLKKSRELCEDAALKGTAVDIDWNGVVTETLLNNYINAFGIDSPQFRGIAALLHDYANTEQNPEYMQPVITGKFDDGSVIIAENNAQRGDYDHFLYCTAFSYDEAKNMLSVCPRLSAAPIPSDGTATGYSMLLMINPNSDNLGETLKFAAELAEEKLNAAKAGKDSALDGERQLSEIYSSTKIVVGVPNELYMDDYTRYLREEISLDEFITEADRKYNAYMNE